jgi:hypothetical protein
VSRHRLPLAPERPARNTEARRAPTESPLTSERRVLAVSGDDALVLAFTRQLVAAGHSVGALAVVTSLPLHTSAPSSFRAAGAAAVLALDDSFVGGSKHDALRAWLEELPRGAWVITAGNDACRLIAPTFSVGLGKRHEMSAAATDLWLGQASELVATALIEASLD